MTANVLKLDPNTENIQKNNTVQVLFCGTKKGIFPENLHRVVYVIINKPSFESFVRKNNTATSQHSL